MSYTALYRSYRPNNFSDVVGQKHVTQTLKNAVAEGRTSHAYVFSGLRGVGKTTIARVLARAVNCEHPVNGEPCNECAACKAILNNETTDIIELDAASNNGVDEIRSILEKVNFLPTALKKKVYIIDEVHMLTTSAFNALLKTLEEPPVYAMFILATTEPHKIPSTILSRCQRFDFKQLSSDEIKLHLKEVSEKEGTTIDEEALELIAEAAEGGMRDALSILDQATTYATGTIKAEDVNAITGNVPYTELIKLVKAFNESDSKTALEIINNFINAGKEVSKVVSCIIEFCRDLLLCKSLFKVNSGKSIYENEEFLALANDSKERKLFYYIDVLNDVLTKIHYSNAQNIYLEVGIMKIISQANINVDYDERLQNIEEAFEHTDLSNYVSDTKQITNLENHLKKVIVDVETLKNNDVDSKINAKMELIENKISNEQPAVVDLTDIENRLTSLEEKDFPIKVEDIENIKQKLDILENSLNNLPAKQEISEKNEPSLFTDIEDVKQNNDCSADLCEVKLAIEAIEEEIKLLKQQKPVVQTSIFDEQSKEESNNTAVQDHLNSVLIQIEELNSKVNNITQGEKYDDSVLVADINKLREEINELSDIVTTNKIEAAKDLKEQVSYINSKIDAIKSKKDISTSEENPVQEEQKSEPIKEEQKIDLFDEDKNDEPKVEEQKPIVEPTKETETIDVSEDITSKVYDIHILENALNEAITQECRAVKPSILDNWERLTEKIGPTLLSTASVLASGSLRANGRKTIIVSYPTAQICNMLMEPEMHKQALEVVKIALNAEYDFLAIPDDDWFEKRMEFASQHSLGYTRINLTPFKNPSLKIISIKKQTTDKDISLAKINDFFGDEE